MPARIPRTFGQFWREWEREEFDSYLRTQFRPGSRSRELQEFQDYLKTQFRPKDETVESHLKKERRDAISPSPALAASPLARTKKLWSLGSLDEAREDGPSVAPRRENVVAKQFKMLRQASAADGRRFNPTSSPIVNVYGAPSFAGSWSSAPVVRRKKRREVLFAKGFIGRRK